MENLCTDVKKIIAARGCARSKPGAAQQSGLSFLLDDDFELRGDAVDQLHGDNRFADDFDGLIERDAALVDLEALRGERIGQIGGSDRAK